MKFPKNLMVKLLKCYIVLRTVKLNSQSLNFLKNLMVNLWKFKNLMVKLKKFLNISWWRSSWISHGQTDTCGSVASVSRVDSHNTPGPCDNLIWQMSMQCWWEMVWIWHRTAAGKNRHTLKDINTFDLSKKYHVNCCLYTSPSRHFKSHKKIAGIASYLLKSFSNMQHMIICTQLYYLKDLLLLNLIYSVI